MTMDEKRIAIVGAGFSGMAVAIQLLRRLRGPARVLLVNRSLRFGRGLAYGTNSPSHLLNVPAGRMGIDPAQEGGFADYLRSRGLEYRPGDFVPRSLYGDYLERALLKAQSAAASGVRLELVESEVLGLDPSGAPVLTLGDGSLLAADEVVLALGNFTPLPPATPSMPDWAALPLVNDVWSPGALAGLDPDAPVLLVGTGLTAYDAVLVLLEQAHRGPITMLSRRALLPQPHRELETPPAAGLVPTDILAGEHSALAMLRAVRRLVRDAAAAGHDWRDVVGGLRSQTPRLWQQLDPRSRGQFLRHLGPYWDTHRHRAAPAIWRRIRDALDRGQLRVEAGRLDDVQCEAGGSHASVRWRSRGTGATKEASFSRVINCTGPSSNLRRVQDPLIVHLRTEGWLDIDAHALGLHVESDYRLRKPDGAVAPHVRYVGPLLKAGFWEATAVPELRVHARGVVDALPGLA